MNKIKNELLRQGMILNLIIEVLESWAEVGGVSLISSQQLNSSSAERNEKVRMLFQNIRELS